jgi:hypothetical protein
MTSMNVAHRACFMCPSRPSLELLTPERVPGFPPFSLDTGAAGT